MENLVLNKAQNCADYQSEDKNNRKRRCSSPQENETIINKKKVLQSDIQNETSITNSENEAKPSAVEKKANEEELINSVLLEDFCDEVLYEIFKYLDTWSLMSLMNVCKRFQKFVLDKRFWEIIDLSQQPLPLGILEDKLERSHNKTRCIKLRGPSPSQHIEGEIQHFNETVLVSFATRCTKLTTLELFGVTLDFDQITLIDFPHSLKRLVLNTCNVRIASPKSLFNGIDTILVNLEELAIEYNIWFDPYYIMALSKLPLLRFLSLRGCWQMQEFIPYGSIAARHGFKQLQILDLRDMPLNDSDFQCFNAVETLNEIYLQCPKDQPPNLILNSKFSKRVSDKKSTKTKAQAQASFMDEPPTTSSSSSSQRPTSIIVPLVGTNRPSRSRFLSRSDHILVNVQDPTHMNNDNYRYLQLPVIEQMLRHNLFWDIVTPLGRIVGVEEPERLFGEENGAEQQMNILSVESARQQPRGTISDRGVCCFGRTRQPVQHGVIWIRFNNRPSENHLKRFSVRNYKLVTDVSLQHLVQCSPDLVFLDVSGTSVTLEGLQHFKSSKPECKVVAEHLLGGVESETTDS